MNVGRPRAFVYRGRAEESAIWKEPIESPAAVTTSGVASDAQADRRVHGGLDQAVYAYSIEDYAWWEAELGMRLAPGNFGENLTIAGIPFDEVRLGERWRIGSVVLEAAQPRIPCWKFQYRMGMDGWVDRFSVARRPGIYLRVVAEGAVSAGDQVHREPTSFVTIYEMFTIRLFEEDRFAELLCTPLGTRWRDWAERAAASRQS